MYLTFAILCVFYAYFMCAAIGVIINDDDDDTDCCELSKYVGPVQAYCAAVRRSTDYKDYTNKRLSQTIVLMSDVRRYKKLVFSYD